MTRERRRQFINTWKIRTAAMASGCLKKMNIIEINEVMKASVNVGVNLSKNW